MRLCVSYVYWTLLLVSVVSSGLLFLIVASEGTQISDKPRGIGQKDNIPLEDNDKKLTVRSDGSNYKVFGSRSIPTAKTEREHLYPVENDGAFLNQVDSKKDSRNNLDIIKQSLTQQPNLSQGISETGQAVVLTLVDTAAAELQSLAEPRLTADLRSRSLSKNTTLKTTTTGPIPVTNAAVATKTTPTPVTTTLTTLKSLDRDQLTDQGEKSAPNFLPVVPIATGSSDNATHVSTPEEESTSQEVTSQDDIQQTDETVVVRAEQKIIDHSATQKSEDVPDDEVRDESIKLAENLTASSELDDGAARAKLGGGSGEESAAVVLDGLVTSGSTDHHHEDIPSFSEWAQKRLEEAEKKKTHPNASIQNTGTAGRAVGGMKVRSKNYASPDCGAKIVAVNPEARSARSVLVSTRDEYMLNTCTSRVWFVVELCEAIQAKKIELANFELFSSSPKDFSVHVSDRFPSREWSPVGHFTAKDQRDIQSFALNPHLFGKFIKVELHSHYGAEHFCPISLFRAYGTSEFEVLETETDHQESDDDHDDDEDEDEALTSESGGDARNLFGSARDAVLRIVKKAAEVLVKTGDPSNKNNITKIQESIEDSITGSSFATCTTPRYMIDCANCTDDRLASVFEILTCRAEHLDAILRIPIVNETLRNGKICGTYGIDIKRKLITGTTINANETLVLKPTRTKFIRGLETREAFVTSIYSLEYVIALCNVIATNEKGLVLNTSGDNVINLSANSSTRIEPNLAKFDNHEASIQPLAGSSGLPEVDGNGCNSIQPNVETRVTSIQGTNLRDQETVTSSRSIETLMTSSEGLAAQIKPTKTMSREDMRKESSVPILEPSKDPNEESIQAEVLTTLSPIVNVATAPSPTVTVEPADIQNSVESTITVTPDVTISNVAHRDDQDINGAGENNNNNAIPVRQDSAEQETKINKMESNTEQEAKFMSQDHMSLDSILSDLKDLESDGSGIHSGAGNNPNMLSQPTASSTPQQKESVFLRLSNRIKALERNMSLSGQYLEELSKRYKKQVEEMQRSLDRATASMAEESRKGEERELRRIEEITILRDELTSLTESMEILLYDRNSWRSKLSTLCQHFVLIIVEIVVFIFVVSYCRRNGEFVNIDDSIIVDNNEVTRRRSAGAMSSGSGTKKSRKRRPSEIASRIVGTYRDLMITDRGNNSDTKKEKKKRRKRESNVRTMTNGDTRKEISNAEDNMLGGTSLPSRRSSSIESTSCHAKKLELCRTRQRPDSAPEYSGAWINDNNPRVVIVENLDESLEENSSQRSPTNEFTTTVDPLSDSTSATKMHDRNITGSIFRSGGGILKAAKLSSPSFMKTALGSRSKRKGSNKSENIVNLGSDDWEYYSRNLSNRSDSGSPSQFENSDYIVDVQDGATNGHNRNTSNDSESGSSTLSTKKEKKRSGGLRKMVRKLF